MLDFPQEKRARVRLKVPSEHGSILKINNFGVILDFRILWFDRFPGLLLLSLKRILVVRGESGYYYQNGNSILWLFFVRGKNGPWLYLHSRKKFYTRPIFPWKSVTWVCYSVGRLRGVGLCYNTGLPDDMQGVIERVRM